MEEYKAEMEEHKAEMEEYKAEMGEFHAIANAYYNNATKEQRDLVLQFFKAMDVDGDGRVSLKEFTEFLSKASARESSVVFSGLDSNGDGQLDLSEVLTLYYVAKTRFIGCDTCKEPLKGLYFTCVTCFDKTDGQTFDLCVGCYRGRNYDHSHCLFLDTYVLLLSKRYPQYVQHPFEDKDEAPQQPVQQQPRNGNIAEEEQEEEEEEEEKIGLMDAYDAMDFALNAATACTIM